MEEMIKKVLEGQELILKKIAELEKLQEEKFNIIGQELGSIKEDITHLQVQARHLKDGQDTILRWCEELDKGQTKILKELGEYDLDIKVLKKAYVEG